MRLRRLLLTLLSVGTCSLSLSAQDFEVDIVPLLRRECIACHGPALQMSGLRLDRRDDAMQMIEPGNSSESLMIQRLVDDTLGVRMPPKFGDGSSMPQRDIDMLKAWIDSGAPWPQERQLSDPTPISATHARAKRLRRSVRRGATQKVLAMIAADPAVIEIRDDRGSTLLHAACFYADVELVKTLVGSGADVNAVDRDGVTPLMLSVNHVDIVKLLLDAGADTSAVSKLNRTALEIAATYSGNLRVVRLLSENDPSPRLDSAFGFATRVLDVDMMRELLDVGATAKVGSLRFAAGHGDPELLELLFDAMKDSNRDDLTSALTSAALRGSADNVQFLLDQGAEPSPALAPAAYSEYVDSKIVKLLLDAGADASRKGANGSMLRGELPLELARRHGHTEVVDLLTEDSH